jgi:hypothetical protein
MTAVPLTVLGVSDFWCAPPRWPRELLVAVLCDAQDNALMTVQPIPFAYVWRGQQRTWCIPDGFRFAPSTTFLTRLVHDPREGPHIVASLFHDYLFGLLDQADVTFEEANAVHSYILAALKDDGLDRFLARHGLTIGSRMWRKVGALLRRLK